MATNQPLKGWTVVVTRPEHQAQSICQKVKQLGGMVIAIPAVEIVPPSNSNTFDECLQNHSQYDLSIFISQNAVRSVFDRMALLGLQWQGQLAAVGSATANALIAQKQQVIIPADADYRSEGVLTELTKLDLKGVRVAIYRAQDGRNWLKQQLEMLGALVTYIESYRRLPVDQSIDQGLLRYEAGTRLVSLCTSVEVTQNYLKRLDTADFKVATNSLMIVPSERVKQLIERSTKNVIVAKSALDADMLAAIPAY
ncbi:MAG: uroporphyrinogen-III synthase [Cryomorphaceae bacterium]